MWRIPPAMTSSRPTPSRASSQTSRAWRSRGTTPWSIAYLTISGAEIAPVCQSRPERTAPMTARATRLSVVRVPLEQRLPRPSVMGVVNVTPDSFSDGGVNFDPGAAAASARRLLAEGAAIVDLGGESTRPGAERVSTDQELRRVVPVLEALEGLSISIDTAKSKVAARALELGAELVNDVTALRGDPELAGVVAEHDAYLCLMHMQGEPRTMQADPRYEDVVAAVVHFLDDRLGFAISQGIRE